jgi:hypothetical protein
LNALDDLAAEAVELLEIRLLLLRLADSKIETGGKYNGGYEEQHAKNQFHGGELRSNWVRRPVCGPTV